MAIVMYNVQEEVLTAIHTARKSGVDVLSSTCSVLYVTEDDEIANKTSKSKGRSWKRVQDFPYGIRKVQTIFGFVGANHSWTEKVRRCCEAVGADGSQFIAEKQNGKSWVEGFENLVEASDKNGVCHLRFYPSERCHAKVRYQTRQADGSWKDMTDTELALFKADYMKVKKPYVKTFPCKDDPTKQMVVDVPSILSLTLDKIKYVKFGGKEFVNIEA